jgi:ParB family chromosome partitioning protein
VRQLQDQLAEKLGTAVQIQHKSSGKGKLVMSYNSLEELDGILKHIN